MRIEGWIFDAYPEADGMRLWVIRPDGTHVSFLDPWQPLFYLSGPKNALAHALDFLKRKNIPLSFKTVERTLLFENKTIPVVEVRLSQRYHDSIVKQLRDSGVELYNADIHPAQAYHYERGHFPLARCSFDVVDGQLRAHELKDTPWALDYETPPLSYMHLFLTGSEITGQIDPNHSPRGKLALRYDNRVCELEGSTEDQLETLRRRIEEWDPDVITTDWGDSHLLPKLQILSDRTKQSLPFCRDPGKNITGRGGRSFFTYGRTVYQSGIKYLFGRWHLDMKNSFFIGECGLDGLFEISRVAKIPVQRASRCTIGTSLSSMQMDYAWRNNILVPMDKQQVEDFRPASDLLSADKGGLVYEPELGWFDNVAEYDFVSMYPQMMVQHNISPETVNCPCCPHNRTPETNHHLCEKRRGLVPSVLEPILTKRAEYKRRSKTDVPNKASYKARATAFKCCLVTCFGYLGFKNARFGKIEAHECVNTWGREVLLRAKEAVESRGFHVIHGLVDSLWVQCGPTTDYEALRLAIEKETACPVGLEGVYKWIRFCPSKIDPLAAIPNRYFGAFTNGELKFRNIFLRRRDTPLLLKNMQKEILAALNTAGNAAECRALLSQLKELVDVYRFRIKEGQVTAPEMAITFHLSKEPSEYTKDTVSTIAAKQLAASGVPLHAGETMQYIITSVGDKVKEWRSIALPLIDGAFEYDPKKYLELLERSSKELLDGLEGYHGRQKLLPGM